MEMGFAPESRGTSPAVCEQVPGQVTGYSTTFLTAVMGGELRSHCLTPGPVKDWVWLLSLRPDRTLFT